MRDKIEQLVSDELKRANEKFPEFSSNHEAYAVLLEEVEELSEFVKGISCKDTGWIADLWVDTRRDYIKKNNKENLSMLRAATIRAIEEAIQVAAMCDKWLMLLEKEK